MKILSDFHDYYDGVNVWGIDPGIVYVRHQRLVSGEDPDAGILHRWFVDTLPVKKGWLGLHCGVVGYCGQVYPVIRTELFRYVNGADSSVEVRFFYETEALIEYVLGLGGAVAESPKLSRWNRDAIVVDRWSRKVASLSLPGVQTKFTEPHTKLLDYFHSHKVPVFVVGFNRNGHVVKEDNGATLNPSLKALQFFRVKDAATAFQEIQGFISGVLGGSGRPMVETSDKVRAESHGFGALSFRKPKGTKKGRPQWR